MANRHPLRLAADAKDALVTCDVCNGVRRDRKPLLDHWWHSEVKTAEEAAIHDPCLLSSAITA